MKRSRQFTKIFGWPCLILGLEKLFFVFGDSYVQRIVYEYEVSHFDRPRGRCYDHNFLRFLTIFGEKIGVFLKNQCYDQNIA
jgi:hypothetical protein